MSRLLRYLADGTTIARTAEQCVGSGRGLPHTPAAAEHELAVLVKFGWARIADGRYAVTDEGRAELRKVKR